MKLRDWLTLAAIVGGLVVMFMITRYSQPERVKPGSPEYVEYIEHYIGECLRSPQAFDKTHSESLSEAEREAGRERFACRGLDAFQQIAKCQVMIFSKALQHLEQAFFHAHARLNTLYEKPGVDSHWYQCTTVPPGRQGPQ